MDWLTTGMLRMTDVTIVVPAVRCICSFCERKLIHSHPNNSWHPFFQPNCKSIMVMPMNVKEFDNFFRWSAGHFSSKFRPKLWISFFVKNAKFREFVRFFVQNEFLYRYLSKHLQCWMVNVYWFHHTITFRWFRCFRCRRLHRARVTIHHTSRHSQYFSNHFCSKFIFSLGFGGCRHRWLNFLLLLPLDGNYIIIIIIITVITCGNRSPQWPVSVVGTWIAC